MFQLNNPKQIALERERPAKKKDENSRGVLTKEICASTKENRESEVEREIMKYVPKYSIRTKVFRAKFETRKKLKVLVRHRP